MYFKSLKYDGIIDNIIKMSDYVVNPTNKKSGDTP